MHQQMLFSGSRSFRWTKETDGSYWYEFDPKEGNRAALRDRNWKARELQRDGWTVRKFSLGRQLRTKGGIGTPYPEITIECSSYGLDAWKS